MRRFFVCSALAIASIAGLVACPGGRPPQPSSGPAKAASASASAIVSSAEPKKPLPPGAVASPVFSEDACQADSDCVAERTCHPDRCISAEHAGELLAGTLCTNECAPAALECGQNHCGCAPHPGGARRCAVLPGP